MIKTRIPVILLAGALAFSLAACGSSETAEETGEVEHLFETEVSSESKREKYEEEEPEHAPDGVWETDGERVTIEDDTVTIDYIDEDGNVTETYWVGSFVLDEGSDTWTSTRDPDAEMTAECDTIEFTWEGTDNIYDTLSYAVTNEDGTKKTVRLERTESLGEVAEGVVPDFSGSDDAAGSSSTSASESGKASDQADTSSAQSNTDAKTADNGSASVNTNTSAESNTSANAGSSSSTQTSGNAGSSAQTGNTGSAAGGSSSSGSTASSDSSGSSGNSGSSGTTVTACSHNYAGTTTKAATCTSAGTMTYKCSKCGDSYQTSIPAAGHSYNGGTVTKAATCSSAGTTTYTCTKCGDSYTTSIPATGNHNWQAVYRIESVKVQDAVYETRVICNNCFNFSSRDKTEVQLHINAEHNGIGGFTSGQVCIQDAVYENQQVLDHYICSVCGATK